jgi:hypothetical protein
MSLRLGALHDALLNAGSEPDLARKAAEEVAAYERQMADLRTDLYMIKWMLGAVLGLVMLVLGKVW